MADKRRATHDLGGVEPYASQAIDRHEHVLSGFDKRVDAMLYLLARKKLIGVDQLRRAIESLPPAEYHALTYYEKWLRAIRDIMVERGVVDAGALEARMRASAGR